MSFIAPAIAAIGGGISTVGQIVSGNAADNAAKANASAATESAAISEAQQRQQDLRTIASGKAIIGASGVTASGSPLDVLAESARQAEINALNIRRSGQLQANADLIAGANAKRASRIAAAGTILTTGYGVGKQVADLGASSRVPKLPTSGGVYDTTE